MSFLAEKQIIENIKKTIKGAPSYDQLVALQSQAYYIAQDHPEELQYVLAITGWVKRWCLKHFADLTDEKYLTLYWKTVLFECPHKLESFLYYMEKNRPYPKRFYQPREKTLRVVVNDLQDLEDRKIRFLGVSQPARTGKSTLCLFFLAWIMLKRPNSHNAMGGHSGILAKGFYKELLNLLTSADYTFAEIYNSVHGGKTLIRDKSSEDFTITLDEPDRFATITCRGIDGTWTGAVDISQDGYLYVDDLIRDRQHSLNPTRMEETYQEYLNKMVDRKNDGARELMVGTLWNVLDPLERLRIKYKDNPEYRFRRLPALNEDDESNFDYEYNGFSTEYYKEMRDRLDKAEWQAKYQQQPFVREGLIFPEDELRYFNGILPEGGFVRAVSACDVAWGGGDSLSMPIGYEYENGDIYIVSWVFNRGTKETTLPIVAGKIMGHNIQQINFEANNGGEMYSMYIGERLKEQNYKCSCTHTKAPNTMNKMAKIIQYSDDIKRRFVFLSPKCAENANFRRDKEYQDAIDEFTTLVAIGKNAHDDAADSLAQLERFLEGGFTARLTTIRNPFFA